MLADLEEVAAAVSERPEAPYYLARLSWFAGETEAARREAEQALARRPDFVPAEVLLGEIERGAPGIEEAAIEDLPSRHRGERSWQEVWLLAYRHVWQGNGPEAAAAFERLRLDSYVDYFEGRFEESAEAVLQLIAEDPEDVESLRRAASSRFWIQLERFGSAWDRYRLETLAFARKAASLYPQDYLAGSLLAMALGASGHLAEGLAMAKRAMEVNRRQGEAPIASACALGYILRLEGRHEEAEEVIRAALNELPQNPFLLLMLGTILEPAGKDTEVLKVYEGLLAGPWPGGYSRAQPAAILNRLGRHEEALEHARIAIDSLPRNTPGHEDLAFALWKLGRDSEALEALETGIGALPGRVRLHLVRGGILESQGRWEEAAGALAEAIELHPGYAEAHETLRRVATKLEKPAREATVRRLRKLERPAGAQAIREMLLGTLSALEGTAETGRSGER